ncbi:uncharacterized protein MESR4 [Chelonus insularis]|uniref:uncharacterized protein MESR4 n=1 Tax=Chelonus insularis TaxID=460826 RepID=UPI00158CDAB8|nr:uncharacterized protein LOC118071306 [Chelonus insularis]
MEDEDGEGSNINSWSIPDQSPYKDSSYIGETLKKATNMNDYIDGIEENKQETSEDRLSNLKVIFKGFKKRILAQTQENQMPEQIMQESYPMTTLKASKDKSIEGKRGKITEYAQYLGLQPAGKYKCPTCHPTVSFRSPSMLKQHQCVCLGAANPNSNTPPGPSDQNSTNISSPNTNNFHITRKVYLCSACGTYFENWNLFLHMREIHKRHICLFCLGMFGQAERLSYHLSKKHSVPETCYTSIEDFYTVFKDSCYLICCTCEKVFSETDNFSNHNCNSPNTRTSEICSVCRQTGTHLSSCSLNSSLEQQNTIERIHTSDSERTLLPNPANAVAKKLLNAGKAKLKHNEKILLSSYQRKFSNLYERKAHFKISHPSVDRDDEIESRRRSSKDKITENVIQTSKYGVKVEESRLILSENLKDRQSVKSPLSEKPYCKYSETFKETSKSSNFWNYHDDNKNREDDRLNNLDDSLEEGEQGELILDDGKEDSSGNSPPTSPICIESPIHKSPSNISELIEEKEITSPAEESPSHSVTRVNSNNSRSLVIKICANKNSQFSVQTPNANGTYTNNEVNDDEDEDIESNEENDKTGDTEAEKDTSINDQGSYSDSGRLTVAISDSKSEEEKIKETSINVDKPVGTKKIDENTIEPANIEKTEVLATTEPVINLGELADINAFSDSVVDVKNNLPETSIYDLKETEKKLEVIQADSDGIILATNDVSSIDLNVAGTLDSMEIDDILKRCIEAASPTCVYCNHARHIAVHGKQLALHMLAEHRFQPQHPAIIIQQEQFISRVKKSLDELESQYFNLDSYDTIRGTYDVPTVRTYECYLCRIYYTVYKELYLHNRKMHQKTILICIMCKSTFYNHSELLCHLCPGVYASNVNIRYRCCMCTIESLPSAFRLMVHLRKRHHACDVCLESTGNQQKLSNHVWKHKLHHLCYRCGIAYRNKPDITKHLFWKHGTESVLCKKCLQKKWPHVYHFCIPPNSFVCEECGSTFSRAVALKVHKRLHSGDLPYGCAECSERFISKKLAIKHEESHKPQAEIPLEIPENLQELSVNIESNTVTEVSETIETDILNDLNVSKEPIKKVVDVYDLPPLNLSSDSDSDTEEEVQKRKKENEGKPKDGSEIKDNDEKNDGIEENSEEIVEETVVSEFNDNTRENDEDNDEQKKEEVVIMNGIWNNFKSYKASLESKESFEKIEENSIAKEELLKLIIAEHDYCVIYTNDLKEKETPAESQNIETKETESSTLINSTNNSENDTKKRMKSAKKKKQQNDGIGSSSSSDSSSDSDSSSCSCGTNCSCSSSSSESSSSSSSSSDSDSSMSENSPKKQSITKKNRKKERDAKKNKNKDGTSVFQDDVQTENEVRSNEEALTESTICVNEEVEKTVSVNISLKESDLETTETETDEDFYDEYPQQHANKLLAEKRNQLMLLAVVDPPIDDSNFKSASDDTKNGIIEASNLETNSLATSTPSLPSKQINKRKVRTKRRKKGDEGRGRGRGRPPGSTNKQQQATESIKLNIPKFLYQNKPTYTSSPNINTAQVNDKVYSANYQVTQSNSSAINQSMSSTLLGNENKSINNTNESKRSSKRKRIPKKFYGDSSDEEQRQSHHVTQKWRKVENQIPVIPYVPNITIKQNFGPPPSPMIQPKIDSPPSSIPESALAPAPSVTDSEEPVDSSSDSNVSESEQVMNSTQSNFPENYSAPSGPSGPSARSTNLYCFCQCPYDEVSEMIACDGENCQIEWFHFECVGIMVPPKGKWYCPNCRIKDSSLPENECYE